ncbi:ejaculatory bulb-specific protein 3-like [Aethina tumida]|uniref:ejaculatory bulb-specific protein 3-like n=1 Tax=Aethina tumida TaxID=116153 RepID=UPI002148A761|nr:ejaculatory bulb-specific protein 3-like [Aethina tumida]
MIKLIFYCTFAGILLSSAYVYAGDEKYTTKYDNVNLNDVVANERLLKNYVDCLLEQGSCTPDGQELKRNMPDAIETDCSKCSDKQKEGSDFIIKFLIDNKPDYWELLEKKYDPSGSYKEKYLASKNM